MLLSASGDGHIPGHAKDFDYYHGVGVGARIGLNGEGGSGGGGAAVIVARVPGVPFAYRTSFFFTGENEALVTDSYPLPVGIERKKTVYEPGLSRVADCKNLDKKTTLLRVHNRTRVSQISPSFCGCVGVPEFYAVPSHSGVTRVTLKLWGAGGGGVLTPAAGADVYDGGNGTSNATQGANFET